MLYVILAKLLHKIQYHLMHQSYLIRTRIIRKKNSETRKLGNLPTTKEQRACQIKHIYRLLSNNIT